MQKIIEYTALFLIVLAAQVLVCNNIELGVYVRPMIVVLFIVLLPMESSWISLLSLGVLSGVAMDLLTGSSGIYTIALTATAFVRPVMLRAVVDADTITDGGVPTSAKLGTWRFLHYSFMVTLWFSIIFFSFEALTWDYYMLTATRILLSTLVTTLLLYFAQLPLFRRKTSLQG